jgi:hypothetical protein
MLILSVAVGNISIAHKITEYIIFTQETLVKDIQGATLSNYKKGYLTYPTKKTTKRILYTFFFFVFVSISVLQILLFLFRTQIFY